MNRRDFLKNALLTASLFPFIRTIDLFAADTAAAALTRKPYRGDNALPLLGFGTMRLPRKNGRIDYDAAEKLIDHAMANGINHFDTAWFYMNGDSENFLGKALSKYPRNSYTLADKLPVRSLKKPEDAERIFNEQLKKCKTGYFDFYLLHALNSRHWETVKKFDLINFVEQKRKEGKIRNVGFSFHDKPEVLQTIVNAHKWDFVLLQINYLDWYNYRSKEQYEIATAAGIPVMVMEPLRGGRLAKLPTYADKILKETNPDLSTASWAFRYAASLPNVMIVLSGMSQMAHLEENIRTFSPLKPLDGKEKAALEKAVALYRKADLIPCTGCDYCLPCPAEVAIPQVFAVWNDAKLKNLNKEQIKAEFAKLPADSGPAACVHCNACLKKCPQKIKIPGLMTKITKTIS